jgi:crotonobetainyl-CoA:carnitine CoA-transferase CaiB-like acyl-CoA transferase
MLDLTDPADREVFDGLVARAHVLVTGLRPGALSNLGYSPKTLQALNSDLITASLDAYGWTGPWSGRRGFDSLVQMSTGIAAAGAAARGQDKPAPLPAQALDHGTGYLLAAAVAHALKRLVEGREVSDIRCSLVATARLLIDHPTPGGTNNAAPDWSAEDTASITTEWGPARRVPIPGRIEGVVSQLAIEAGPLGRHTPAWAAR